MPTTLSLEASKIVHALVGEYETECVYCDRRLLDEPFYRLLYQKNDCCPWCHRAARFCSKIPAPTFSELIRVLPKIMKSLKPNLVTRNGSHGWGNTYASAYMDALTEPEGMAEVESYLMKLLK